MEEITQLINNWQSDALGLKPVFLKYYDFLANNPELEINFKGRPGVSYSLRAKNKSQKKRDLFTLIDVIDDDPESRWLSICFYADLVTDPEETGDFVPEGLLGEDAICFNLDENNVRLEKYIFDRIAEAAKNSAE